MRKMHDVQRQSSGPRLRLENRSTHAVHRHAIHAPTAKTGLVGDVLSAIRETVNVYPPRTRNAAVGAVSNASSAPCAFVRPMLKYCDRNGVKLIVRVEMMFL